MQYKYSSVLPKGGNDVKMLLLHANIFKCGNIVHKFSGKYLSKLFAQYNSSSNVNLDKSGNFSNFSPDKNIVVVVDGNRLK
jgi:hypothetical protein